MRNKESRISVLIVAYGCEPGKGSEPGTGWNTALNLAKYCNVTVLTRSNNRDVIDKACPEKKSSLKFKYVDPPRWAIRLKKKGLLPVQVFYGLWHIAAFKLAKREQWQYDICHHITFNTFEVPPIVFLGVKGKKVWGPIGGGQSVPQKLLPVFGRLGAVKESLRNIRVQLSSYNPLVKKIVGECSLVYFANHETRSLIQRHLQCPYKMMIDVGVDVKKFQYRGTLGRTSKPIKILIAGYLSMRKGTILMIKAMKELLNNNHDIELSIIGNGPAMKSLKSEVYKLGVEKNVIFHGVVDHKEMAQHMHEANFFAFPSLRDTSGTIVLEAMAVGLPVVAFDHQGVSIMLGENHGELVPTGTVGESVKNLVLAFEGLIAREGHLEETALQGRNRIEKEYAWDTKAQKLFSEYNQLLENRK